MNLETVGNIRLKKFDQLDDAQLAASKAAANVAGFSFPVTIFRQGTRTALSGALPMSFIRSRLERKSAPKKGGIMDAINASNRPLDAAHAKGIGEYLTENMAGKYILPPLALNLQQPADVYTLDIQSTVAPGYLVLPMTAALSITDGQHRVAGVQAAIDKMVFDEQARFDQDAMAVMITCESDLSQIHQDFADAAKTKPLPASQLAVYDRRNVANGLVLDLVKACPVFDGKIDATSSTLSKRSSYLFLANQVRVLAKTLITGSWKDTEEVFETKAGKLLGTKGSPEYINWLGQFSGFINQVVGNNNVLAEIAALKPDALAVNSRIPALRDEGWICMTTTGLQIIGCLGHDALQDPKIDAEEIAQKIGALDWSRTNPLWKDALIGADGKILTQSPSVQEALRRARQAVGLTTPTSAPITAEEL
ncbi:DNA sulfur modification protein DndB [Ramlibacter sp. WS9]|uniref:DNA sulfur modification protein DndB n=1 Tax=Ramlibacter sp. WS9 TaxID=1882741 RepID=UPI0013052E52|nr:DNA sulfur modification protein DndB [Ramlibacter sp. WS9]